MTLSVVGDTVAASPWWQGRGGVGRGQAQWDQHSVRPWDHGWFSSSMKEPMSHTDTVSNFSLTCWLIGCSATPPSLDYLYLLLREH